MRELLRHFGWDFPPENARRKKYPCVFCNDCRKHMSIDFVTDTFLCYRCGNHGGMLDLYRQVYGICGDNRETTVLIKKQLGLSGNSAPLPSPKPAAMPGVERPDNPTTTRTDAELDRVYRALLGELPLSGAHKASLLARGLTAEEIRGDGYKSVPMGDYQGIARRLLNQGLELHGIPGFFTVKRTGRWSVFVPAEGFFVPIRNLSGQITGMQVRVDRPVKGGKYIWFSSNRFRGHRLRDGTKVRVDLHYAGDFAGGLLGFTEGALKANVARHLYRRLPGMTMDISLIAYQGVGALANLETVVSAMGNRGFTHVMELNDRDKLTNDGVRVATGRLCEMVEQAILHWPQQPDLMRMDPEHYLGKGIDDHILAMLKQGEEAGRPSQGISNPLAAFPPREAITVTKENG